VGCVVALPNVDAAHPAVNGFSGPAALALAQQIKHPAMINPTHAVLHFMSMA
jgi:hypothetical protein